MAAAVAGTGIEVRAVARNVRISPQKVRLVLKTIKGKPVREAEAILRYLPHKAAGPIGRVKALPLIHPDFPGVEVPGVVTLVIVPDVDPGKPDPAPMPSQGLLQAVCRCLDQHRLLTTEVHVIPPAYLPIRITAEIVAPAGTDTAELREAALGRLDAFFHPLTGGADGKGWPFGGDISYSRVVQRLLLPGVASVDDLLFRLDDTDYPACTNVPVGGGALLRLADDALALSVRYETSEVDA